MQVRRSELISQPCFLDYIVGGCHLSLIVAVDLSESNLPQSDKASMHYQRQKGAASACQQAFCTLAEVALVRRVARIMVPVACWCIINAGAAAIVLVTLLLHLGLQWVDPALHGQMQCCSEEQQWLRSGQC